MLLSELIPHLQTILETQGDMEAMKYRQGGRYSPLQAPEVAHLKIHGSFKRKVRWQQHKDNIDLKGSKFLPL